MIRENDEWTDEVYKSLYYLEKAMNTYFAQAMLQEKESEFHDKFSSVRDSVKDFIIFKDSLYR